MTSQTAWHERRRAAQEAAFAIPDRAAWVEAIAHWWSTTSDDGSRPTIVAIPEQIVLATPGGAELASAINAFVARAFVHPSQDRAIALVGQAVAREASSLPPSLQRFEEAVSFCEDGRDDLGSFEASFVLECERTPEKMTAWTAAIEASAPDPASYGNATTREGVDLLRGTAEQEARLRESHDYRLVWRRYGWSGWYHPWVVSRFRVLMQIDRASFARAIDRVPSQAMRDAIMEFLGQTPDSVE